MSWRLVWHAIFLFYLANVLVEVALESSLWLALGVLLSFVALYEQGRHDGPRRQV